jgi:hypothetical protein
MKSTESGRSGGALVLPFIFLGFVFVCVGCGGDDTSPDETGTTLQGTVSAFQAQAVTGGFELASTPGVTVAIGSKSTQTDANGDFTVRDFGVGTQHVLFSRDGGSGTYVLTDIERGDVFALNQVVVSGGQVSSQHTGTWVGTGGSTDPSSQGFVTITMIIAQNGNALSGTASIPPPDNTSWNISGTENGHSVEGTFTVTTSNSSCASDGAFTGTFTADTLDATFVEVRPDDWTAEQIAECGPEESGLFRVVKQ